MSQWSHRNPNDIMGNVFTITIIMNVILMTGELGPMRMDGGGGRILSIRSRPIRTHLTASLLLRLNIERGVTMEEASEE